VSKSGAPSSTKTREENEVKIAVSSAPQLRALLKQHGFQITARRVYEQNIVLDQPGGTVRASGRLLRVRVVGKKVICTYKGLEIPGPHKRREEREFSVSDLTECLALFAGLGFTPAWRYEKYRTEFARESEPGVIMLDETPIGVFLELEGPSRWIDRTAKELGFSPDSYIFLSYARLYAQWCEEDEKPVGDMVFDA
jgi:adenylate cyclase class 2